MKTNMISAASRGSRLAACVLLAALGGCAGSGASGSGAATAREGSSEVVNTYAQYCLRAFPDKAALDQVLQTDKATPIDPAMASYLLQTLPGKAWLVTTAQAHYQIVLQDPPYASCAVRTQVASAEAAHPAYLQALSAYASGKSLPLGTPQQGVQSDGNGGQLTIFDITLGRSSSPSETSSYAYDARKDGRIELRLTRGLLK